MAQELELQNAVRSQRTDNEPRLLVLYVPTLSRLCAPIIETHDRWDQRPQRESLSNERRQIFLKSIYLGEGHNVHHGTRSP
jgi:hypothetical protein